MSIREAMPPRTTHQGLCPWTLLGDLRSPDTLCPPPLNPGCATGTLDARTTRAACMSHQPRAYDTIRYDTQGLFTARELN